MFFLPRGILHRLFVLVILTAFVALVPGIAIAFQRGVTIVRDEPMTIGGER